MYKIPKKWKIATQILWKFTILDVLFIAVILAISMLLLYSNIPNKLYLTIGFIGISSLITLPRMDDIRLYTNIATFIGYSFVKRNFNQTNIHSLIPTLTNTQEDGIISFGNYYSSIVSVDQIEFRLLSSTMQSYCVSKLATVLNSLDTGEKLQLIKVDRPIVFDSYIASVYEKLQLAEKESPRDYNKIGLLKTRIAELDTLNTEEVQYTQFFYFAVYGTSIETLNNLVYSIKDQLATIGLAPKVLSTKEYAVLLDYTYSPLGEERKYNQLSDLDSLEECVPKSVVFNRNGYTINELQAFVWQIKDYPLEVPVAWGVPLFSVPNTKVVLNIVPLDSNTAIKQIDRTFTELLTQGEKIGRASELVDNRTQTESSAELLENLKRENEILFTCNIFITAYNTNNEPEYSFKKKISSMITKNGFKLDRLVSRQQQGFLGGSLNGLNHKTRNTRGINTTSLAAIFPFTSVSTMDKNGYLLGYNDYPVILDIWKWKNNPNFNNANAYCLGTPGSGKSFFTKLLIEMLYSDSTRIFILDPENEYNVLVKNFGGKFIDVGNATEGRLNPFHIYEILTEDGKMASNSANFQAQLNTLTSFFSITLDSVAPGSIKPSVFEQLNDCIIKAYKAKKIDENTNIRTLRPSDYPTFDTLMQVIQSSLEKESSPRKRSLLEECEILIKQFTTGQRNSNLWNGPTTIETKEKIIVFNFQSLFQANSKIIANAQMLLVMRFLEQQITNFREHNRVEGLDNNQVIKSLIAIDEGYNFVNKSYPIALDFIATWYKRARKYDCSMFFTTQNLSDLVGNPDILAKSSSIVNNSQYSFIFKLKQNELPILQQVYHNSINETEEMEIETATKGRCFLVSSDATRTSFDVDAHTRFRKFFEHYQKENVNTSYVNDITQLSKELRIEELKEETIGN